VSDALRRSPALLLALTLIACPSDPDDPDDGPRWSLVFEELDPALLSVWGSAHEDVWAVGADAGDGPMVLRYDGAGWTRLPTGATGNLWWVSGHGDEVWMAGVDALILRFDRMTQSFETMTPPETDVILFGILPISTDDVWAVGGNIIENRGVLWRYDGAAWAEDPEATALTVDAEAGALFKIWGESSDDLFVVGANGVGLRRTADGWASTPIPTGRRLFTVHGSGDDVVAVGGFTSGLIVEWDGAQWVDVSPPGVPQLNGIHVEPSGRATAAGIMGAIWRREARGEAWVEVGETPPLLWDYHAAYVDPQGDAWAVGGFVISEPFNRGVLAHYGLPISATID
jgi:hypothetical protein